MQNILITGGAGFIGSHLSRFLLSIGHRVYCVDNLISGSKKNISDLTHDSNFTFIELDVIKEIDNNLLPSKIDSIFHLASPASPNANSPTSYLSYPIETLLVNSYGTNNMLKLALKHNARFLYASSSEVYGDPSMSPQTESYFGNVNPNGIRSVYDEGKRFGEAITMAYVRKENVDARIIRIFNTYGPHMLIEDGRVVTNFINQAIRNKPITIYGDGLQTRSFSYVSDTVDGLVNALFVDNLKGEVFNIGNPIEKSVLEFAKIIKGLTNSNSELVFADLPEDDPKQRKPDIKKAQKMLNFSPKIDLEEGLKKTIEYFKTLKS